MTLDRSFFEQVLDAFEGFVADHTDPLHVRANRQGVKVWFGSHDGRPAREHYEAQLIRADDGPALEIGFHAEHADPARNEQALRTLLASETQWRVQLGDEPRGGPFLGRDGWTRLSELWEPPDEGDPDAVIEVAARLADYVDTLEPVRAP